MITAALVGSGDWGSQRDALAAEQAAVVEETQLQALLVRKSRGRPPGDAALSPADELELVG
jgi:hypothetical protein